MLTLGCALVECDRVFAVNCDEDALAIAQGNVVDLELDDSRWFSSCKSYLQRSASVSKQNDAQAKRWRGLKHSSRGGRTTHRQYEGSASIILMDDDGIPLQDNCVDTLLTYPPFGTKHNAGMDILPIHFASHQNEIIF
jgi:hypothetical protein